MSCPRSLGLPRALRRSLPERHRRRCLARPIARARNAAHGLSANELLREATAAGSMQEFYAAVAEATVTREGAAA